LIIDILTFLLVILTALSSFLTGLETKTLQSDFTLTISADATQPINYIGNVTMCGEQFRLNFLDMEAAYDGKTLYLYQADTDELTLSHPTEQELMETNPFLYARALSKVCNITERTANNGQTIITLTPKDQTIGIQRFVLTLDKNEIPIRAEIHEGKKVTTLSLKNAIYVQQPFGKYQLQATDYPTAFVNDLR